MRKRILIALAAALLLAGVPAAAATGVWHPSEHSFVSGSGDLLSLTRRNRKGRGGICMNVSATSTARPVSARSSVGAFRRPLRSDRSPARRRARFPRLHPTTSPWCRAGC